MAKVKRGLCFEKGGRRKKFSPCTRTVRNNTLQKVLKSTVLYFYRVNIRFFTF